MNMKLSTNRKFKRMFANVLSIFVILAMAFPVTGNASAQEPNPRFVIFPESEWFDGNDWPDGATVNITVEDKPECATSKQSPGNFFNGGFPQGCDIVVGDTVTFTDSVTPRTHTVRNLAVTAVDKVANTVSGTAGEGETVYVWPHATGQQLQFTVGSSETWQVDFTGLFDLVEGTDGRSEIRDEQGNSTAVDWRVPNPTFGVRANTDQVEGWEWTLGSTITVTVDDPATTADPDITRTAVVYEAPWNPAEFRFDLNLDGVIDIQTGFELTASDGSITKTHVVPSFGFTDIDLDLDTVTGFAPQNSRVNIWTCWQEDPCINRDETADQDGNWVTNFAVPGEQDWEQQTADLRPGSWIDSSVSDEDGDSTMFGMNVPNPHFTAFPEWESIEGWEWPEGSVVHLTIEDPVTPKSPDYAGDEPVVPTPWDPNQLWVNFNFANAYDMKPGDIVTLDDGETPRTHTVRNLAITAVDAEEDTVAGTADEGAVVYVWPHATGQQLQVIVDATRTWQVDFTDVFDLVPGEAGRSEVRDEQGNSTAVDWSILNPHIWADPICECVNGWEWNAGDTITIQVFDQDGNEFTLQNSSQVYAPDAGVFFDLSPEGIDLQPGYRIVMSDGYTTKELMVTNLAITKIDITANTISGNYDPAFALDINVWDQERLNLEFGGQQWVATFSDLPLSAGGEAFQTDEDGDQTGFGWDSLPTATLYDIYTYDVRTRAVKRITKLDNAGEYNPSWSPNGKYIAHDVVSGDSVMVMDSHDIYVTNVATGKSIPLKGAEGGNDAAWSPNGLWIAFDRRWMDDPSLYVVPFTGGQRRLVRENAVSADWAPHGLRLVIQDLADDGKIKTIGLFGHVEYTIADYGESPAWSPDGNWIAYQKDGDIWKVRVTSLGVPLGKPIQVTKDGADEGHPTWSADSKTIVYSSAMGSDYDLWTVPAAGGRGTWLNGVPEFGDYDPDYWKNIIAYESVSPDSQIARFWVSAFTYDPPVGIFTEGTYPYHFKVKWNLPTRGEWEGQDGELVISGDAPLYDGRVLLRGPAELRGVNTPDGLVCEGVEAVNPKQRMRFLFGWATDSEMTYPEAMAHFKSMIVRVLGDGASAVLVRNEIHPFTSSEDWFQYVCTYTMRK